MPWAHSRSIPQGDLKSIMPMKHHSLTLITFVFFLLFGGSLVLLAPRLAEEWYGATALTPPEGPQAVGRVSESLAAGLAVPRRSDDPALPDPGIRAHRFDLAGETRQWWGFDGSRNRAAAPVVLLLHGSGRSGRDMMQPWQEIAQRDGLVLIAPDAADPQQWAAARDGRHFLEEVLLSAAQTYPIDPAEILLFGHSAGASFALSLAADPPEGVRAIGAHAGAAAAVAETEDALPLRLYVGDRDHLFSLEKVRASAEALAAAGHPTDLVVIPGHDHWYYDAAPGISADLWSWFASK